MTVQRFCGFVVTCFSVMRLWCWSLCRCRSQERDGGAAALMDDLHSAGLRIDLAYLLGVAVLDADHVASFPRMKKKRPARSFTGIIA